VKPGHSQQQLTHPLSFRLFFCDFLVFIPSHPRLRSFVDQSQSISRHLLPHRQSYSICFLLQPSHAICSLLHPSYTTSFINLTLSNAISFINLTPSHTISSSCTHLIHLPALPLLITSNLEVSIYSVLMKINAMRCLKSIENHKQGLPSQLTTPNVVVSQLTSKTQKTSQPINNL
jgi:hypothetical protein